MYNTRSACSVPLSYFYTMFAPKQAASALQMGLTWSQVTRTVHWRCPWTSERLHGRSVVHQPVSSTANEFSFSSNSSVGGVSAESSLATASRMPRRRTFWTSTRCIRHSGQSETNRHPEDSQAARSVGDRSPVTGSRRFRNDVTAL